MEWEKRMSHPQHAAFLPAEWIQTTQLDEPMYRLWEDSRVRRKDKPTHSIRRQTMRLKKIEHARRVA